MKLNVLNYGIEIIKSDVNINKYNGQEGNKKYDDDIVYIPFSSIKKIEYSLTRQAKDTFVPGIDYDVKIHVDGEQFPTNLKLYYKEFEEIRAKL